MFDWFKKKDSIIEEKIPIKEINFIDFHKIAEFLYIECGITDLDKRVLSFSWLKQYALDNNINSTDIFLALLNEKGKVYQDAINIVTVNETYFFREKKELIFLVEFIKKSPNRLKILSLPCSSGEEIYSILIMMLEKNIPLDKIELSGYDIDMQMIKKAEEGIYNEYSLHNVSKEIREKYFDIVDNNNFQIKQFLKQNIKFKQQNIFEIDIKKESYDVVLSRNMMIYFDDLKRDEAMKIITNILKKDSIFIKGHADLLKSCDKLKNIAFGVYKKLN